MCLSTGVPTGNVEQCCIDRKEECLIHFFAIPDKKILTSSNRKKSETIETTDGCKNRGKYSGKKE